MDAKLGVYATEVVPADIDSAMDHLMEKYGFSPPLVDLVYEDPYQILIENAEFGFCFYLSSSRRRLLQKSDTEYSLSVIPALSRDPVRVKH